MKNLIVGIAFLFAANVAFAQGLAQDVDALQLENEELKAVISELVALQRCHAIGGAAGWTINEETGTLGVDWRGCDKRKIVMRGPLAPGRVDHPQRYEMDALLVNARLVGTDFSGAFILGVAMNGANLEGANFTNAWLNNSDMTGALIVKASDAAGSGRAQTIFNNTRCPDGTNSDDNDGDEFTCDFNRKP